MAKRVTKTTLQRVKARKAAKKSLVEPESKEIVSPEAGDMYAHIAHPAEVPDQWPQNGKPNWPLAGGIFLCISFWLATMWYFFG